MKYFEHFYFEGGRNEAELRKYLEKKLEMSKTFDIFAPKIS